MLDMFERFVDAERPVEEGPAYDPAAHRESDFHGAVDYGLWALATAYQLYLDNAPAAVEATPNPAPQETMANVVSLAEYAERKAATQITSSANPVEAVSLAEFAEDRQAEIAAATAAVEQARLSA